MAYIHCYGVYSGNRLVHMNQICEKVEHSCRRMGFPEDIKAVAEIFLELLGLDSVPPHKEIASLTWYFWLASQENPMLVNLFLDRNL